MQPVYKHQTSLKGQITRAYNRELRKLEEWCRENHTVLKNWQEADNYDVCILSRNEYEIESYRKDILSDNNSRFLEEDDYDKYQREKAE